MHVKDFRQNEWTQSAISYSTIDTSNKCHWICVIHSYHSNHLNSKGKYYLVQFVHLLAACSIQAFFFKFCLVKFVPLLSACSTQAYLHVLFRLDFPLNIMVSAIEHSNSPMWHCIHKIISSELKSSSKFTI